MASVELTITREPEAERVLKWRCEELERAGYDRLAARELAARKDVDLHVAVRLARGGCPAPTALRILL